MKGFYLVTDGEHSAAGVLSDAARAVEAGTRIIQYRNKTAETRTLYDEAMSLKNICAGTGCLFVINDRVDIALAVDADGVHIGQEDMPYAAARRLLGAKKIIGVTVHGVDEAREAESAGADYLGVSPIFATATKADAGAACGVGTLAAIRRACRIPLAAIGGIDLSNVDAVITAGADMVCAISAVVSRPDVAGEILKYQGKFSL